MGDTDQPPTASLQRKRTDYFADVAGRRAFDKAFLNLMSSCIKQVIDQFVSPRNSERLRHGRSWEHPGLPDAVDGGMQKHSSELIVKFEEVVAHDLQLIDKHVSKVVDDMVGQFFRMMYSTVSAACDKTGNIVDGRGVDPLEAFAAALEMVQFSADKHGAVTLPQFHLSPEAFKKMQAAQRAASPEFAHRIEAIKARKTSEALQHESDRKARFVRYGEDV